jgi:hypothetical protein
MIHNGPNQIVEKYDVLQPNIPAQELLSSMCKVIAM